MTCELDLGRQKLTPEDETGEINHGEKKDRDFLAPKTNESNEQNGEKTPDDLFCKFPRLRGNKRVVVVRIGRQDTTTFSKSFEQPMGKIPLGLLDGLNIGDLQVLSKGRKFATVGLRKTEAVVVRTMLRFEPIHRYAGGISMSEILGGEQPVAVRFNGEILSDHEPVAGAVAAGDRIEIILFGRKAEADFDTWWKKVNQRAEEAYRKEASISKALKAFRSCFEKAYEVSPIEEILGGKSDS